MASAAFERVNPAWTTSLGWTAEEIEGRPYSDFVHPDDLGSSAAAFEAASGAAVYQRCDDRPRLT
jgi:PAS domain S-box-containing protein